jgi:hypothetical protein
MDKQQGEKNKMKKTALLEAALMHFKSEKSKAAANLEIYLTNPSAIGDHPDLVAEVINLIKAIAAADECIKVITEKRRK